MIPNVYKDKPLVCSWAYHDINDKEIGVVARYQNGADKKDIVPFFKGNSSGWKAGIDLTPRPLYGLELLSSHSKNEAVFIVEGEKTAAALQSIGCIALTSIGGSKAANKANWEPLSGRKTAYLLPDNDEPGEQYIKDVHQELSKLSEPPDIQVLRFPESPEKGDFIDWQQSFLPRWDGYSPVDKKYVRPMREELAEVIKLAEPVPENWGLAGLAGAGGGVF